MLRKLCTPSAADRQRQVSITADSEDAGSNSIVNYREADWRATSRRWMKRFWHPMHSIGDRPSTRVALDAHGERPRASGGSSGIPTPLAHLRVGAPGRSSSASASWVTYPTLHLCLDHAPACL